ncbi:MAG: peptidylprolyl isomerase [Clostridia bacterium]|nr:peptidylprolyl isomerase [Clostridia bacterium]
MKNKGLLIIAAVIVVIALAIAIPVYYVTTTSYVATVAGEKISKSEYQFFLAAAKSQMETAANLKTDEDKANFWKGKEDVQVNAALDLAKRFKIELIKAKEKKIVLDKQDTDTINTTIESMKSGAKAQGINFEDDVKKKYNISLKEYTDIYKEYVLIEKYQEDFRKQIKVSDDDVKKSYDENKSQFNQATVKHILILTQDEKTKQPLPEDKQQEAKKKAEEVLAKAKAGGDFAALAKEYSQDPGSKDSGGEYTFPKGQMVPEFEKWSFDSSRKPGDMDIVKTSYGYHVMKFEAVKETSFDEAKTDIQNTLINNKFAEEYTKQIEDWMKDAKYNVIKNTKVIK